MKEKETLAELSKRFNLSPSKITKRKEEFIKNAFQAFERPADMSRKSFCEYMSLFPTFQ